MQLTQEQIFRLGKLTALHKNTEISLDSVLSSVDDVRNTDTKNVETISRSGNSELITRDDVIIENENFPDELLACSQQKVASHQIVLAGIMHGE